MTDASSILTFPSTHCALRAERVAKAAAILVKMVPVPRHLSPDCNMGMKVSAAEVQSVEGLLASEHIEFKSNRA